MPENPRTREIPRELYATRAMTRFHCIAERCEDTCCRVLAIPLTWEGLERMRAAMAKTEAGKARFLRAITREGATEDQPGALARVDGCCTLLDEKGLCSILTGGHGSGAMPDACVTFPRRFGIAGGTRVEVHGSCACPEVARLTLLADDGLDLVPADPGVSELYPVVPRAPAAPGPYGAPLERVRAWGLERLRDAG